MKIKLAANRPLRASLGEVGTKYWVTVTQSNVITEDSLTYTKEFHLRRFAHLQKGMSSPKIRSLTERNVISEDSITYTMECHLPRFATYTKEFHLRRFDHLHKGMSSPKIRSLIQKNVISEVSTT